MSVTRLFLAGLASRTSQQWTLARPLLLAFEGCGGRFPREWPTSSPGHALVPHDRLAPPTVNFLHRLLMLLSERRARQVRTDFFLRPRMHEASNAPPSLVMISTHVFATRMLAITIDGLILGVFDGLCAQGQL